MNTGLRDHLITAQAALARGVESTAHADTVDMPACDALEFVAEMQDLLYVIERSLTPVVDRRGFVDELATFGLLHD